MASWPVLHTWSALNQQLSNGAWDPSGTFSLTTIDCGVTAASQFPSGSSGGLVAGASGPSAGTAIAVIGAPGTFSSAPPTGPVTYTVTGFTDHVASTSADVIASGGSMHSCDTTVLYGYAAFTGLDLSGIFGIQTTWTYNGTTMDTPRGLASLTLTSARYAISTVGNSGRTGPGLYVLTLSSKDGTVLAKGSITVIC